MFGMLTHYFEARRRSEDLSGHFRNGLERLRNRKQSRSESALSPGRQLVLDLVRRAVRLRKWRVATDVSGVLGSVDCPECPRSLRRSLSAVWQLLV